MAGMSQVVLDILMTPVGAIGALIGLVVIGLFARWVFTDQPQK
jgi:hypothetical protein